MVQNPSENKNSNDDFPCLSMPSSQTRPEYLRTIGKIFGMVPPLLEEARILELGCTSGENLFCFASNFPKAELLGIDSSKVQIEKGQKKIRDLGLKNLELRNISVAEIDDTFGQFDYIICHNVFSFVQEELREKILDIIKNNLVPNGIAYINYSTLPGWNMKKTIKDMMRFHASLFSDAQEKIVQSVSFLDFVSDGLKGNDTAYAHFLNTELDAIKTQKPIDIFHEYLENDNTSFYFHEFLDKAKKHGLAYLGDASIASMYGKNLGEKINDKLSAVVDIVESEQYMDFFTNRKSRDTLLCHEHIQLHHNRISSNIFDECFIGALVSASQKLQNVDLENGEDLAFIIMDAYGYKNTVSTSSKLMKAFFYTLMINVGYPVSIKGLVTSSIKKLHNSVDFEGAYSEILQNLLELIFSGLINISFYPPLYINKILDRPKVSSLVRYEALQCQSWVTNQENASVTISAFSTLALRYMDGKHTIEEILDQLVNHVERNELIMHVGTTHVNSDREQIRDLLLPSMHEHFNMCILNKLLIA